MPIPVTCSCGSSFAAPDNLAGKTVQCPKCKSGLAIPNPAAAAVSSSAAIFDDAGIRGLAADQIRCPNCDAMIANTSVLCVQCGYHIKLGKKLQGAKSVSSGGHGDGHAATAEEMLERARDQIAEDKEAKKREMDEGSSLWSIVLMFTYSTAFLLLMLWLPGSKAFFAGGAMLVLTGLIGAAFCIVRISMIGFEQNLLHGFMSIFLFVIYPIMKWDKCGPLYVSMLSSFGVMGLGIGMIALGSYLAGEEAKQDQQGDGTRGSQVWPLEDTRPLALGRPSNNCAGFSKTA